MSTEELLAEALKMPVKDRAELAAELLASLDGPPDEDVEAAWANEIRRRIDRARAGESTARDWESVRDEMLDRCAGGS